MVGFKTSVVKHSEKVDFLPHVVANTPQDRSSYCRISRYGESSFPRMRTAWFLDFLTFGHRSRGHRSDLLKVSKEDVSPTPPLSLFQFFRCCFLAIFSPVSCLKGI